MISLLSPLFDESSAFLPIYDAACSKAIVWTQLFRKEATSNLTTNGTNTTTSTDIVATLQIMHYVLIKDILIVVSEAFVAWKDDRRFVNCLMWHRASPGPLAEMVDPDPLFTFHNGAVCHLEHLWPHCSVRREGTWGTYLVEFEIRCSDGQTLPLPCSRYGVAWIMQSGFSPQLFFFLVAWDTLWSRIFQNLNYISWILFQSTARGCSISLHAGRCLSSMSASSDSFDGIIFHSPLSCRFGNLTLRFIAWYISARNHAAGGG